MNSCKTLVLALVLAHASTLAAASDDFPRAGNRLASDANAVDGTGTFSVNPRFRGNSGEGVGPDPAEMNRLAEPTSDRAPLTESAMGANPYAWSEVYLPTPQPRAEDPAAAGDSRIDR